MTINEARSLENMNPIDGGDELYVPLNWQKVGAEPPPVRAVTERSLSDGTREVVTEFASPPADHVARWGGPLPPAEPEPPLEGAYQPLGYFLPVECRETARDLSPASQRSVESRWRLRDVFEKLLAAAAGRLVTAEVNAIRKEIAKIPVQGEAAFSLWLDGFLDRHAGFAREVMGPVILAMFEAVSAVALDEVGGDEDDFRADLEAFSAEYTDRFGSKHAAIHRGEIERRIRESENPEAAVTSLGELLDDWSDQRAGQIALSTATDGMAAISTAVYAFAGVSLLRWVWNGGECKICPNLHGKIVAIGTPFVRKGDKVGDPDVVTPLEIKQIRNYPGLHGGCRCTVAPG